MVKEFSKASRSYQNRPGFSNQTVECVGQTVSRSFLAEVCDNDRLMGTVTPSGISLIEAAKHELNMRSTLVFQAAGRQAWIDETNLPSPVTMLNRLQKEGTQDQVDWLWIELGSIPAAEVSDYQQLVSSAIGNGCTAIILYTTRVEFDDKDHGNDPLTEILVRKLS